MCYLLYLMLFPRVQLRIKLIMAQLNTFGVRAIIPPIEKHCNYYIWATSHPVVELLLSIDEIILCPILQI